MTEFEVLDACCLAGNRIPNEDALGHSGAFAWVIDGATPLSPRGIRASSWARALSSALAGLAPGAGSLDEIMGQAVPLAAEACGYAGLDGLEPHELVSASGVLALAGSGCVDVLTWGDCEAAVLRDDGTTVRCGDATLAALDARVLAAKRAMWEAGMDREEAERRHLAEYIVPTRALMNAPGGYASLTPDGSGTDGGRPFRVWGAQRALLFSDGLAWAFDGFGTSRPEDVLEGRTSLSDVARSLRAAENADAGRERVMRFKVSDDTTGLLLGVRED